MVVLCLGKTMCPEIFESLRSCLTKATNSGDNDLLEDCHSYMKQLNACIKVKST